MSNVTEKERYEIADYIRKMGNKGFTFSRDNVANAIGSDQSDNEKCWLRLADLIEPIGHFTLTDLYWWAFENLEGCDEPEFSLYDGICGAIQRYFDEISTKKE